MQDTGLHNYCLIHPGKELNESTVNEIFKEVQNPDWCEIDKKLQQLQPATVQQPWETFDDEKQKNTELHAHGNNEVKYTWRVCGTTQKNNIVLWQ